MFIVAISLLRKILSAYHNLIRRILAYTFLNICEKIYQFLSNIKNAARRRKLVPLFCVTVYMNIGRCRSAVSEASIDSLQVTLIACSRLPLLSARPAVTFPVSERHSLCTNVTINVIPLGEQRRIYVCAWV